MIELYRWLVETTPVRSVSQIAFWKTHIGHDVRIKRSCGYLFLDKYLQYSELQSSFENTFAVVSESMHSSFRIIEYYSLTVTAFKGSSRHKSVA